MNTLINEMNIMDIKNDPSNPRELYDYMIKKNTHWVLWSGDEAPEFLQFMRCSAFDEVIVELHWKYGFAKDTSNILLSDNMWFSKAYQQPFILDDEIIGTITIMVN